MQYVFRKNVTVQGVPHQAGDVVDESEIPVGSLECMIGDFITPFEPPAVESELDSESPVDEPPAVESELEPEAFEPLTTE